MTASQAYAVTRRVPAHPGPRTEGRAGGPAASPPSPPCGQPMGPTTQPGDGHRDLLHGTEGQPPPAWRGFARSGVRAGRAGPSWRWRLCRQDSRRTFQPLLRASATARGAGTLQTAAARGAATRRPRLPPGYFLAQLGVPGQGHAWARKGNSVLREPPKSLPEMRQPPESRALSAGVHQHSRCSPDSGPMAGVPITHKR